MELFIAGLVLVGLLVLVFKRKRPGNAENVSNGVMQPGSPPAPKDVSDYEWEQLRALEREAEIAKVRSQYNKRLERALRALSPNEGGAEGGEETEPVQPRAGH